jgi:putative ABC transport system substrate-binding protein
MIRNLKSKIENLKSEDSTECPGAGGSGNQMTRATRQEATGNSRRAEVFACALCAVLYALCFSAHAQQPTKIPRIGYVSGSGNPPVPGFEAFRQGLQELGYSEGKSILFEYRGSYDVQTVVAELVQHKVNVLVVAPLPAIQAAKQATKKIPIVMVTTQDPVETGIIASLARPGGNITGVTSLARELSGKRLELLKEVVSSLSRVGILRDADGSGSHIAFKEYETAARPLKLQVQSLEVRGPKPDFEAAFQAATKGRLSAVIVIRGRLLNGYTKRVAELSIKNRLPSIHERSDNVEVGGLMSYAASDIESFRRAATYVDKILKGMKPADLPVEQPTKFELVINLKTAKQIGLTIPPNVLVRADRVIR